MSYSKGFDAIFKEEVESVLRYTEPDCCDSLMEDSYQIIIHFSSPHTSYQNGSQNVNHRMRSYRLLKKHAYSLFNWDRDSGPRFFIFGYTFQKGQWVPCVEEINWNNVESIEWPLDMIINSAISQD